MSVSGDSNCTNCDEQKFIEFIENSKHSAVDILFKYRFNKLYRVAYYILRSHSKAEALAQDVLFNAYKNPAGFKGDSLFLTWMCRQVIQRACDLRRSGTQVEDEDFDPSLFDENTGITEEDLF